jgi:hypothetical protein
MVVCIRYMCIDLFVGESKSLDQPSPRKCSHRRMALRARSEAGPDGLPPTLSTRCWLLATRYLPAPQAGELCRQKCIFATKVDATKTLTWRSDGRRISPLAARPVRSFAPLTPVARPSQTPIPIPQSAFPNSPDDHLWSKQGENTPWGVTRLMIIFVRGDHLGGRPKGRSDGHLWAKRGENRPEGVTPLMAIYGEMAIYGNAIPTPNSRLDPRAWPLTQYATSTHCRARLLASTASQIAISLWPSTKVAKSPPWRLPAMNP